MTELTIRGIPHSLSKDAWWLETAPQSNFAERQPREVSQGGATKASPVAFLLVFALMLLADFLFWDQPVGVSLVIFSAAVSGAAIASLRPQFSAKSWSVVIGIWIASSLPVIEYMQFVSVIILLTGHLGLLVWCALQTPGFGPILSNVMRLPYLMPMFSFVSGRAALRNLPEELRTSRDTVMLWVLPVIVSGAFLYLFLGANPLFERWLDSATQIEVRVPQPWRMAFWIVAVIVVYPFVAFHKLAKTFKTEPERRFGKFRIADHFINAQSITVSLALFNVMFLVQNLSDIAFLWGNATLPPELTYAKYAQQGAYPLMATSILAGLFVLIYRRYIGFAPFLKMLLLIWIFQNIFLVSSAFTRLGLYVDAYGLTYLRIRAGIGMGLVVAGMALLAWQLWFGKSNGWVTVVFAGIFAATLYTGSFVNFGYLIARENLSRQTSTLDSYYLCRNTPLAITALLERAKVQFYPRCVHRTRLMSPPYEGWRDWGFRDRRLASAHQQYLAMLNAELVTPTTPRLKKGAEELAQ